MPLQRRRREQAQAGLTNNKEAARVQAPSDEKRRDEDREDQDGEEGRKEREYRRASQNLGGNQERRGDQEGKAEDGN